MKGDDNAGDLEPDTEGQGALFNNLPLAQNRPVGGRESVDALTRAAPVPAPLAAPTLAVLAILESPGSLDAGLGRPEPVPGAATRDGGRSALPAAALGAPADAERAIPAVALTAAMGRAEPELTARGAARSLAARFGRWMPAKREAGAGAPSGRVVRVPALVPELDVEPVDIDVEAPWGGAMLMTTLPWRFVGGRCTPRGAERAGTGATTGVGASEGRRFTTGSAFPLAAVVEGADS